MELPIVKKSLSSKRSFWLTTVSSSDCSLEVDINLWLATNLGIEIKDITQPQSGSPWMPATLVISICYQ